MTFSLVVAGTGTLLGVMAVQIRLGSAWAPGAENAPALLAGCVALSAASLALSAIGWRWVRPRPHRRRRDLFDDAVTMLGAVVLAGANIHLGWGSATTWPRSPRWPRGRPPSRSSGRCPTGPAW